MRGLAAVLTACVVAAFASGTFAALTPAQETTARKLIAQFTAPEFDVRQKAVDALVKMGADVVPLVKKALADTNDNEVKLRCNMVLKALGADKVAPKPPASEDLKFDAGPSRVTINAKDQPLGDILRLLAEKSGNKPLALASSRDGKRTASLAVNDRTYWEAVGELCRQTGMTLDPTGARLYRTLRLRGAVGPKEEFSACSGPAVVWLVRSERGGAPHAVRSFRPDPVPGNPDANLRNFTDPAKLRVVLRYELEDRNVVLDSWVKFTKVTASDGRDLTPPEARDPLWNARTRLWGERSIFASSNLALDNLPPGVKALSVEGVVHADYAVGRREVAFEDVFAAGAKQTVEDGDRKLTFEAMKKDANPGEYTVEFSVTGPGNDEAVLADGGPTGYGFALVDPKGARHAEIFGWARSGRTVGIHFRKVPQVDGEWNLIYTYPARVETREFAFALKDIPLP